MGQTLWVHAVRPYPRHIRRSGRYPLAFPVHPTGRS
jgi:hypothetical protein